MQRIVISLSDDEHGVLRRLAFERHVPIARLIRDAIDHAYGASGEEVQRPGRKKREDP